MFMAIFFIIYLIIFIPLLAKNKKAGLFCSMILLFFIWAFQYKMVYDWDTNMGWWLYVNKGGNIVNGREPEPIFGFLLSCSKSIGFFGWSIVVAAFDVAVICYFYLKFVPSKYYWLALFVMMSDNSFLWLWINSQRQTLSMMCTSISVLFLIYNKKGMSKMSKSRYLINWIFAISFLLIAYNIHSASFAAILFLLIPFALPLVDKTSNIILFIVVSVLYISRFFLSFDTVSNLGGLLLANNSGLNDGFGVYMDDFSNYGEQMKFSIYSILFLIFVNIGV